jgi:replicative DNA helicase
MRQLNIPQDFGKIPPQAIELEEAVLGAIMLEKDAIIEVIEILKPESFYREENQKIFKAIIDLYRINKGIDILTIGEQLRKNNQLEEIGGPAYLSQLQMRVSSAYHIEFHAQIIHQKYIQRELIRISSDIQNRAFDESIDVKDLIDYSESEIFKISIDNIINESEKLVVIGNEYINYLAKIRDSEIKLLGVPSGFTKLDRITSGWQDTDLIIIAARPGNGKTSEALIFAMNASDMGFTVDFYSLEMSKRQLFNKALSNYTGLENSYIRSAKMTDNEWNKIEDTIVKIENLPLYIDDTPALKLMEFRAKARRNKMKYGTKLIIVDYLQLMRSPDDAKGGREAEVSSISRGLKAVAKELNVPIIALSQLNRSIESRGGSKRPQLSDLRESGAIEQDADIVIFIHIPEKYGILTDEEGNSTANVMQNIIAKHRNGACLDVDFYKNNNWTKITDYSDMDILSQENIKSNDVF